MTSTDGSVVRVIFLNDDEKKGTLEAVNVLMRSGRAILDVNIVSFCGWAGGQRAIALLHSGAVPGTNNGAAEALM